MSRATRSRPTNSEALGLSRPSLAAPSVSVSVARMAAPCTSPVAASMPEGVSTESTRSRLALTCAITCIQSASSGRLSPMPNSPSTTSAGAGSRSSGSFWRVLAGSVTLSRLTSRPGRCPPMARTSSPLWPLPASSRMASPGRVSSIARFATTSPTWAMTSSSVLPDSHVAASQRRICSTVMTGNAMTPAA